MPSNKKKSSSSVKDDRSTAYKGLSRIAENSCKCQYKYVIGIDEAGRGPLCGPIVAAACYVPDSINHFDGVMDSKISNEHNRELTYEQLMANKDIVYGVSIISNNEIDRINILQATMLAMRSAVCNLLDKIEDKGFKSNAIALIDGNRIPDDMPVESKYVIKGDGSIFSIAAASIIAKVVRDRIMAELDSKYPIYGLAKHKGYPTFEHRTLLHTHGPCDIYRFSYNPVKLASLQHNYKMPICYNTDTKDTADTKAASKKVKISKISKDKAVKSCIITVTKDSSVRRKKIAATINKNITPTRIARTASSGADGSTRRSARLLAHTIT